MAHVPLEIVQQILHFLDASTLEVCTLVNRSFHSISQELLSSDLTLSTATWSRKTQFLLRSTEIQRYKRIKKLTFRVSSLYPLQWLSNLILLTFLAGIGPQLNSLVLVGPIGGFWDMLYPVFKDCLFKQVLPHIRSLELVEIRHIPLTHVLSYCRCLQTVSISAKDGNISLPAEMDPPTGVESIHLPKIRSFSVNGFVATDFSLDRSISHFLEFGGDHISSLYLCAEYCDNFPLALDFLPPLPALRHNLHDLSFGIKVYKIIAIEKRDDPEVRSILPLSTFQNLCTLNFTIWLPYHTQSWNRWFKWLARNIPHAPASLRTLYFKVDSLYYPPYMVLQTPDPEFAALASGRNFVIHCNVVRRYLDDDEKLQTAVDVLKAYLRSWLDEKKLEISFSDFGGGNQGY